MKLGLTSEEAKSFAGEHGGASQHLLADYSVTPSLATPSLRTPRTPANEDTVLQEVQTILALQNVQTPLKGTKHINLIINLCMNGIIDTSTYCVRNMSIDARIVSIAYSVSTSQGPIPQHP